MPCLLSQAGPVAKMQRKGRRMSAPSALIGDAASAVAERAERIVGSTMAGRVRACRVLRHGRVQGTRATLQHTSGSVAYSVAHALHCSVTDTRQHAASSMPSRPSER